MAEQRTPDGSKLLKQSDIDVLLATLRASQESAASRGGHAFCEVKIYDFARPDGLPVEIQHALESVSILYSRALSLQLSSLLAEPVQVEPLSVELMTFSQSCYSIPAVTCAGTFSMGTEEANSFIELNPHLAWYILDCGLGGHGETHDNAQEFTGLEKGLLEDLFRRMLRELSKCWEDVLPQELHLHEVTNDPLQTHIAMPDDRMIICSFGLTLANMSGMSYYSIPMSALDFDLLLNRAYHRGKTMAHELLPEEEEALVAHHLLSAQIPLRVCFPDIRLDLGDIALSKEGDTLTLEAGLDHLLEVRIGHSRRFWARPTTIGEKLAIEIDSVAEEETNE